MKESPTKRVSVNFLKGSAVAGFMGDVCKPGFMDTQLYSAESAQREVVWLHRYTQSPLPDLYLLVQQVLGPVDRN